MLGLTTVEYFAGIGLVRMGLEPAGWRIVFANDKELSKFEMYSGFFLDAKEHYVVDDIFNLDPKNVPEATLATCSFPCIDLSLAGNMSGIGGKHSSAFWGFVRILQEQGDSRPPLVMVENVPGWLNSNYGEDFLITVKALNNLGYICDVFILDARRFVAQSRQRVYLVGSRQRAALQNIRSLLVQRQESLTSKRLKTVILQNKDLKWTYINLPTPPPLKTEGLTSEIVEALGDEDDRWWSATEVQRHLDMMAVSHRTRVDELMRNEPVSYRTFYRRRRQGEQRAEVRRDDIAGCLRTAGGGSSRQFVVKAGKGKVQMRTMTAREYARLQGVPDQYAIEANGNQALTGFGDAVCVPVIEWIAENVLAQLV